MILYSWSARRSGAAITITGVDALGSLQSLTGIQSISPNPSTHPRSVIAKELDGTVHQLAIEPRP